MTFKKINPFYPPEFPVLTALTKPSLPPLRHQRHIAIRCYLHFSLERGHVELTEANFGPNFGTNSFFGE